MAYDHIQTEEKWLKRWREDRVQGTGDRVQDKEKMYLLFAFAYPSGSGLHVGHVESKTALDIMARYYRMNGKQVFFPVGWDAFGLPAENYAVKTGIHPAITTKNAIKTFERQVERIGISYDWQNEIATNHPGYYKWTQWIFLQLYKKGLAYKGTGMVNWCPSCQTVLANEQVVDGKCERCGTEVVQKDLEQWYFAITKYQDELISGLDQVDWPQPTKLQQLHWIGKKQGVEVDFSLASSPHFDSAILVPADATQNAPTAARTAKITCFTTRIDTIFGVTFVVIAPEVAKKWMSAPPSSGTTASQVGWDASKEVREYVEAAFHKTEEERKVGEKEKTGVDTGIKAINPVNGEQVPVFVADYVLMDVGTGCVMGVPAHDERDKAFAKKFGIEIREVVSHESEVISQHGRLIHSGAYDGLTTEEAMEAIPAAFPEVMKKTTTYKLRDWLISRQRYWGAPIPVVYDPEGNAHPVKEEHLPWLLPTDVDFKPTGESPLKSSKEFVERTERLYGKGWRPEYDTMDTFVDSSWYYLRYTDARNEVEFASKERLAAWLPVDFYMIGPEHIVLHLLYSRFFTKFLRDEGYLNFDEPFMKMRHQGMILGPDHRKMSKSKGNVIDPDEVITQFGADTLRMYEMFMGPIGDDKPWSTTSVIGVRRFLNKVWELMTATSDKSEVLSVKSGEVDVQRALHATIKKVTEDIPLLKFNTAIAELMKFVNIWEKSVKSEVLSDKSCLDDNHKKMFIKILAPFAPFMAEELWQQVRGTEYEVRSDSVHEQPWPAYDAKLAQGSDYMIVVQVNGKMRLNVTVSQQDYAGYQDPEKEVRTLAEQDERLQKWIEGKEIRKVVFVSPSEKRQGLLNWVVGE